MALPTLHAGFTSSPTIEIDVPEPSPVILPEPEPAAIPEPEMVPA